MKKKKKKAMRVYQVRLSPDIIRLVQALANKRDVSAGALVRKWIDRGLHEAQKKDN